MKDSGQWEDSDQWLVTSGQFRLTTNHYPLTTTSAIALVITLLMLSVITFLAVAFLVLTRTHRDSVTASIDETTAKTMSQAALARAQSEIVAHIMAHRDIYNFDYMASHNFINPNGFTNGTGSSNLNNVNYDFYTNGSRMGPNVNPADWAQNIANLSVDPRPPVFIRTNANPTNSDFRFWVDLNRNGKFETNGYLPFILDNGQAWTPNNDGVRVTNFYNGEPEWIGVLQYPEYPHSATNRFIGRYAYLVQPIGKMLDFDYIHNYDKSLLGGSAVTPFMPLALGNGNDGFLRDQGVGSWELNLAGLLWDLDTNIYYGNYIYTPTVTAANLGTAFDDAYSFLRFRYNSNYGNPYPANLLYFFGSYAPNYFADGIDQYGLLAFFPTNSYPLTNSPYSPWPGGYTTNHIYSIQDLFNTNKTSLGFANNRLLLAGSQTNSYDRYMFQRLLSSIGTGSQPELQTYVYDDPPRVWNPILSNYPAPDRTRLRTKVNLNYDNTFQIANGLNTSPTTLVPWTSTLEVNGALGFFTNAAESLLRSQEFPATNSSYYQFYPTQSYLTNTVFLHFGLTNIPIYSSINPSIRYSENVHRMLQLAANIYDASRTNNTRTAYSLPFPSVFRPFFFATNYGGTNRTIYIAGYVSVTNDALTQISRPFVDFTDSTNFPSGTTNYFINLWGIPWVVGAVKGLPAFDRYVADTSWVVTRKVLFTRNPNPTNSLLGDPTKPPAFTNQYLIFSISNVFGLDAWNPYFNDISVSSPFQVIASNYVTIVLTNNSSSIPCGFVTNFGLLANPPPSTFWHGSGGRGDQNLIAGMLGFLQTNLATLPPVYFSEKAVPGQLLPVYSNSVGIDDLGTFQPLDRQQTEPRQVYNWTLTVTNRVMYALVDRSGQAFDFVNLGPFSTFYVLNNLLSPTNQGTRLNLGSSSSPAVNNFWNTNTASPGALSVGVLTQITNGMNHDSYLAPELNGIPVTDSNGLLRLNLYFSCSNTPVVTYPNQPFAPLAQILLVNDPLVHYTLGDLTPPPSVSVIHPLLAANERYTPWITYSHPNFGSNMAFQDPLIVNSDSWVFPNNKFPTIGWLGRVHRGTPWQTMFLKADADPVTINTNISGLVTNYNVVHHNQLDWVNKWVSTLDTYPTNDYALLDLFTAAPNDNASRGLLSVNQMNSAPWYALFSGINLNTSILVPAGFPLSSNIVDPTNIAPLLDGFYFITNGANNELVTNYHAGITAQRAAEPDGVFHNIGSVFKTPALSIDSPFLVGVAGMPDNVVGAFRDEEVEAIPQQVAGLLKLGQPQFVIYGFGQALKPKDIYFGGPPNFNLCTNYQITGEYVTRTVCHIVGDPTAASVKIQVDSFNILPAD